MTRRTPEFAADTSEEISALIEKLHNTGQRLEELTAGQVDTVANSIGKTFVLQPAQEHLRRIDAEKQAAILNALPAHIALLDARGVIISVNDAWRRFSVANAGDSPRDQCGVNYLDICDRVCGEGALEAHQFAAGIRAVLSGATRGYSTEYPCHSPTEQRWYLAIVAPLGTDRSSGVVVMHVDISERKRDAEKLVESEFRFREIAKNIHDVFFLQNLDGSKFYYVSPAYEEIWGRTCESLYANPSSWTDSILPADLHQASHLDALGGSELDDEFRIVRPDGSIRWVHVREFPIRDNAGNAYRTAGIASDVTQRKQMLEQVQESGRRFHDLLRDVQLVSVMLDCEGRITFCNAYLLRLTGWRSEEVVGRNWFGLFAPADNGALDDFLASVLSENPDTRLREREILTRSGERRLIRWNNSVQHSATGEVIGTACIGEDITERQQALVSLMESQRRLALATEAAQLGVWDHDLVTGTLTWDSRMRELYGIGEQDFDGTYNAWRDRLHPEDRAIADANFAATLSGRKTFRSVFRVVWPNGEVRNIEEDAIVQRAADGTATRITGVNMDVTERVRVAAELLRNVTHDLTTGLPRFALIEAYLQSSLVAAAAKGSRVVVLYVDIDNFHAVNETRGRSIGDDVLRLIAGRLCTVVGTRGKVAHVAGDEFVLVQIDVDEAQDQIDLGESVRAVIAEPMEIAQQQIYVTCSLGVSCFPDNAPIAQELLHQAEAAMRRAKREGRNAVSAFSNDQNEELRIRLGLGSRLRVAIRDRQLLLHYQPQVSGLDWQVLGFEALVRWQDPELGLVMPKVFIQAAEELGLIVDLGRYVLTEACRQARAWIDAGASEFSIWVNISPLHLQRPEFVDTVRSALAEFQLPPHCIGLELTESAMADNVERMIGTMQALKALGVRIALDDFGTGYSSLNYLRRFPIECLKIDQAFVRDVTTDAGSAGICRAVITLGHQLGMKVMAEGVETAAQVGYLKRNDCDLFQGYYFCKPVAAEKALELLRQRYLARDDIGQDKRQQTLLLVDDEINISSALRRTLRRDGYRILTASCAEDALDILGRETVHVILSDQRMPGMSGTQLLSKVKDMHPEIVRMVLSGYTDLDAVTNAINEGAIYKFLTKPWNDEELRTQIRDAFRRYRSNTAKREYLDLDDRIGGQAQSVQRSLSTSEFAVNATL